MSDNLFFYTITTTDNSKKVFNALSEYSKVNSKQLYLIDSPLGR